MSETERGRLTGGEHYIERGKITPETLRADNESSEAEKRRKEWEDNRENKRLTLLNTCSDARIITPHPTSSVVVRSIAVGRDLEPFGRLIEHKSIDNVHIMGHHSGKATVQGEHPRGCGGLGVKEDQIRHGKIPHSEVEEWVAENVYDSDCLYQAFTKAADVQEFTDKEILLSTQDHLDHTIYPMAGYFGNLELPIHYQDFGHYSSSEVYKDGIPSIPSSALSGSSFDRYIKDYFDNQLPGLLSSFSEHDRTSQEVQTPKMLLITTNVRPPEVCYPTLTQKPNRVFVETLAREKINDGIKISDRDIRSVVTQAQYPILNFSSIDTLFIETGSMDESVRIARAFEDRKWYEPWAERKSTQVILAESKAGRLEHIKTF